MLELPPYVVVTPARNEAEFIESTIQSMVAQTVLPLKWVIVSDGSTDSTDEIVKRYAAQHDWIELLRMPERNDRSFAGKAYAFNAGQAKVAKVPYEVIACLDADITFERTHFAYLLEKLDTDPMLGLVGAPNREVSGEIRNFRFTSDEEVSGTCQVFRRKCIEAIGGYAPVKGGNIDTIAAISTRMNGWKTRTFTGTISIHHRKMGTAQCSLLRAWFNFGAKDYSIGNHPVWELFRSAYQATKKPFVLRGLALVTGYVWALMRRAHRPVSRELIGFHRREQMRKLKRAVLNLNATFTESTRRTPDP